jgi:hypothetical protein
MMVVAMVAVVGGGVAGRLLIAGHHGRPRHPLPATAPAVHNGGRDVAAAVHHVENGVNQDGVVAARWRPLHRRTALALIRSTTAVRKKVLLSCTNGYTKKAPTTPPVRGAHHRQKTLTLLFHGIRK